MREAALELADHLDAVARRARLRRWVVRAAILAGLAGAVVSRAAGWF